MLKIAKIITLLVGSSLILASCGGSDSATVTNTETGTKPEAQIVFTNASTLHGEDMSAGIIYLSGAGPFELKISADDIKNAPDTAQYAIKRKGDAPADSITIGATYSIPHADIIDDYTTLFTVCMIKQTGSVSDCEDGTIVKDNVLAVATFRVEKVKQNTPALEFADSTINDKTFTSPVEISVKSVKFSLSSKDVIDPPANPQYFIAGKMEEPAISLTLDTEKEIASLFEDGTTTTLTVCIITDSGSAADCKEGVTVQGNVVAVQTFVVEPLATEAEIDANDFSFGSTPVVEEEDDTPESAPPIEVETKDKADFKAKADAIKTDGKAEYVVISDKEGAKPIDISKIFSPNPESVDISDLFNGKTPLEFFICVLQSKANFDECKPTAKMGNGSVLAVAKFKAKGTGTGTNK